MSIKDEIRKLQEAGLLPPEKGIDLKAGKNSKMADGDIIGPTPNFTLPPQGFTNPQALGAPTGPTPPSNTNSTLPVTPPPVMPSGPATLIEGIPDNNPNDKSAEDFNKTNKPADNVSAPQPKQPNTDLTDDEKAAEFAIQNHRSYTDPRPTQEYIKRLSASLQQLNQTSNNTQQTLREANDRMNDNATTYNQMQQQGYQEINDRTKLIQQREDEEYQKSLDRRAKAEQEVAKIKAGGGNPLDYFSPEVSSQLVGGLGMLLLGGPAAVFGIGLLVHGFATANNRARQEIDDQMDRWTKTGQYEKSADDAQKDRFEAMRSTVDHQSVLLTNSVRNLMDSNANNTNATTSGMNAINEIEKMRTGFVTQIAKEQYARESALAAANAPGITVTMHRSDGTPYQATISPESAAAARRISEHMLTNGGTGEAATRAGLTGAFGYNPTAAESPMIDKGFQGAEAVAKVEHAAAEKQNPNAPKAAALLGTIQKLDSAIAKYQQSGEGTLNPDRIRPGSDAKSEINDLQALESEAHAAIVRGNPGAVKALEGLDFTGWNTNDTLVKKMQAARAILAGQAVEMGVSPSLAHPSQQPIGLVPGYQPATVAGR